jgi:hypothetical protein
LIIVVIRPVNELRAPGLAKLAISAKGGHNLQKDVNQQPVVVAFVDRPESIHAIGTNTAADEGNY